MTSEDVKWTYETYVNPEAKSQWRSHVARANIVSITTPDDYTVVFEIEKPTQTFLFRNTLVPIESKKHWEGIAVADMQGHDLNVNGPAVGTGPYKFVEFKRDEFLRLEANENWWGGKPFVDELIIKFIPEAGTALSALETGEVDILHYEYSSLLASELDRIDDDPDLKVKRTVAPITLTLSTNGNHDALVNPNVRKAIALAIPREHICTNILKGLGEPAEQMIPPWSWGHNPDIPPIPYDVELAKEYMKKAGYDVDLLQGVGAVSLETWLYPAIAGLAIGLICGIGVMYYIKRKPKEE
jgi:peptide/nickel transport system substrate-binding protein